MIDYSNAVPTSGSGKELNSTNGKKKESPVEMAHPYHSNMLPRWKYYRDHYDGGPDYPAKYNPLSLATGYTVFQNSATKRYLWQYPQEPYNRFNHRLDRAVFVDVLAPVVDFYAATVGKQEYALIQCEDSDDLYKEFIDNCDLQGQDFLQFMLTARSHAAIYGHTFILADMPRNDGIGVTASGATEADAKALGLRPYLIEIEVPEMINWKLDKTGQPTSIMFKAPLPDTGDVSDGQAANHELDYELRYWSTTEWRTYQKLGEDWAIVESGTHGLGRVPISVLYHKRCRPWQSESLVKNSSRIACLLSNWASALDEAFENQMFAVPVLKSKDKPSDVGIGVATALHLNPEENEDFYYVTPETNTFESSWSAFFRLFSMAMRMMGMGQASMISETPDEASGRAKAWDYVEAEKVMSRMSHNEQECALELMDLVGLWTGKTFSGVIQYSESFDLTSLQEDYQNLVLAQQAQFPIEFLKEFMKQIAKKQLPSLDPDVEELVLTAIENMDALPSPQTVSNMFATSKLPPTAKPSSTAAAPPEAQYSDQGGNEMWGSQMPAQPMAIA